MTQTGVSRERDGVETALWIDGHQSAECLTLRHFLRQRGRFSDEEERDRGRMQQGERRVVRRRKEKRTGIALEGEERSREESREDL